jgi:hypothetical protein
MGTRARAHAGRSGHGHFAGNLSAGKVLPVNGVAISHANVFVRPGNTKFTVVVVEISNGQHFQW